ncbi:MAG: hypothetical protein H7Z38_20770, partial [Rubrivivax sp.]|nr:hypothetical protein [Pyrinomonadaceae bacterium]
MFTVLLLTLFVGLMPLVFKRKGFAPKVRRAALRMSAALVGVAATATAVMAQG